MKKFENVWEAGAWEGPCMVMEGRSGLGSLRGEEIGAKGSPGVDKFQQVYMWVTWSTLQ